MKKIRYILLLLLCLPSILTVAQPFEISGRITDVDTKEVLPFVNIVINTSNTGGISDINGKFYLKSNEEIKFLRISYVGFLSDTIFLSKGQSYVNIEMQKNAVELKEVIILPGINPAHRIIDSAIVHRKSNDPFSLNSFTYESYGKFFITVAIDSFAAITDSIADSTKLKMRGYLERYYMFFMENFSERKFKKPALDNETVIASKVSGFSDPLFSLLLSQIQSFAFYKDLITISDKNYVNPISRGSTNKYFFLLKDTIFDNRDTVFVISYRPKKNKKFDALQGVLYIHTDQWALQSVIAEPTTIEEGVSVKIKQNYSRPDGKTWFPSQLHTDIYFFNVSMGKFPLFGRGITELSKVKINPELRRRDFPDATVSIEPDANEKNEDYWNELRPDTLSKKEQDTYHFIDSLGKEMKFERLYKFAMILMQGKIPLGLLNLDLNRIYNFNEVESSRLGIGLSTGHEISKKWTLSGYVGYGFRDKKYKFGSNLKVYLKKARNLFLNASFKQDVRESGGFMINENTFNIFDAESFRSFFLTRAEYFQEYRLGIHFKIGRNFSFMPSIGNTFCRNEDDILYGGYINEQFVGTPTHTYSDISLYGGITFGEKRVSSENYNLLLGSPKKYPSIKIKFKKGILGLFNGSLDFWSAWAEVSQSIKSKYYGTFSYKIMGGACSEKMPLSLTFNTPASYRKFTIALPNSFETMRMNEFYNNRFVFLFMRHSFDYLIFGKGKFAPIPEITTNIGIGNFTNLSYIKSPDFKIMKQPYIESGFFLNNLLKTGVSSIGFGIAYRYGYYHLPKLVDNFAFKISLFSTL